MRAIEDALLRPDGPVGVPTCRGMGGGGTEIGLLDTLCAVVKCGTSAARGWGAMRAAATVVRCRDERTAARKGNNAVFSPQNPVITAKAKNCSMKD
jgi:hypothetical protein